MHLCLQLLLLLLPVLLFRHVQLFEHGPQAPVGIAQPPPPLPAYLPACPQDVYRSPVKLSCGHLFCSDCCGEWFERERTCPMCRAAVGPPNKRFKSFADGRTPLFPLLF